MLSAWFVWFDSDGDENTMQSKLDVITLDLQGFDPNSILRGYNLLMAPYAPPCARDTSQITTLAIRRIWRRGRRGVFCQKAPFPLYKLISPFFHCPWLSGCTLSSLDFPVFCNAEVIGGALVIISVQAPPALNLDGRWSSGVVLMTLTNIHMFSHAQVTMQSMKLMRSHWFQLIEHTTQGQTDKNQCLSYERKRVISTKR